MEVLVNDEIERLQRLMQEQQRANGSWRLCFEGPPMTDAYMIMLLRTLEINDEEVIRGCVQRLLTLQTDEGTWKLFDDEEKGNLSATAEAYIALLYSGYVQEQSERMKLAKQFILRKGGLQNTQFLTKAMLAHTGDYPWPKFFHVPIEFILLPQTSPINFFDFVSYARVHFAPLLITSNIRFTLKAKGAPDVTSLNIPQPDSLFTRKRDNDLRSLLTSILTEIKKLALSPLHLRRLALKRAEQYMLERIEPDGTLYSYFTSTYLMIFALLALGYNKDDPLIRNAVSGLKTFLCQTKDGAHIEFATSTVWDTALVSHALQQSGVHPTHPMITKAGSYLLSRQHQRFGDWVINNPNSLPGGWGFSDSNTTHPDVDDTTAALRAIKRLSSIDSSYQNAWNLGVHWILSMQNDDGGWSAFEKNQAKAWIAWLPIEESSKIFIDPSTVDLTGRTLEFLGNHVVLPRDHPPIKKAIRWLRSQQERDGSWYGRWGISYIYGTWAALTGLTAVGVRSDHPMIKDGANWLIRIQNDDGGWGESCKSDQKKTYVPLAASTPSQTAWAIDALLAVYQKRTPEIDRGINYLLESSDDHDWSTTYPTGAAFPGGFYIHYHSYRYIWPLIALSHYKSLL
ncbi:squalene--hopene cyclase [Desertibacillus haloalkaliphilus]|uniref:squalene--hopene cyclase n=1 Tax=Desertibacillus haloalkaliphilus TaxID=1328930 RepID=UPI001C27CE17|nr:squalene--hopene cyclase [Desertibacillus haloalkaliphilus]MBU8907589.1 squalene--hopene cyclase [Desertibacillus haloalkaliphilus]